MTRKSVHLYKNSNDIKPHVTKISKSEYTYIHLYTYTCQFFPKWICDIWQDGFYYINSNLEQYDNTICYLISTGLHRQ